MRKHMKLALTCLTGVLLLLTLSAYQGFAGTPISGGILPYTDQSEFETDFPGLPKEDFEESQVAENWAVGFPEPLNSTTNVPGAFVPGDILDGLTVTYTKEPGLNDAISPSSVGGGTVPFVGAVTFAGLANTASGIVFEIGGSALGAGIWIDSSDGTIRAVAGSNVTFNERRAACPTGDGTLVFQFAPGGVCRMWWNNVELTYTHDSGTIVGTDFVGTNNGAYLRPDNVYGTRHPSIVPAATFIGYTKAGALNLYANQTIS